MAKRPKGRKLTPKEDAVIRDVVKSVKGGEKFSVSKSVERIYDVSSKASASSIAYKKMANEDFRITLLNALEDRDIIGADSKVEQRLTEGLDAEAKGETDYRTRLEYIKEINKIAGVYAPEKRETKSLKLNLDMTKEELESKIASLKDELSGV